MKLRVLKFGGTSMQTQVSRKQVLKHIKDALNECDALIVVVSALGRLPDPYATDTLLQLIHTKETSKAARREQDLLLSCGETIAAVVLSTELQRNGIGAIALTGAQAGIRTDEAHRSATIKHVDTDRLKRELQTYPVIVVAGFQGQSNSGEITTIGRGGSDTTAVALAAALKADAVHIFTDVNGMMTADPHIVKNARSLQTITYTEMSHLAYDGAKIIHPQAIDIAMQAKMPIRIRSTFSNEQGTLITWLAENEQSTELHNPFITGITYVNNLTQFTIQTTNRNTQTTIFQTLAAAGISLDFINILPDSLMFTIPANKVPSVRKQLVPYKSVITTNPNCAKISIVSARMRGKPGVTATISTALTTQSIDILQAADSHTTIWILIKNNHLHTAINTLHDKFQLHNQNNLSE